MRTTTELADVIIAATCTVERIKDQGNAQFYSPLFAQSHHAYGDIKLAVREAQHTKRVADLARLLRARGYDRPAGLAASIMQHVGTESCT